MGFVGVAVGSQTFLILRFLCYGLFLHLPLLLIAATWLLRKSHRSIALFTLVAALITSAVAVDAFFVEPEWLEVTHRTIESDRMRQRVRIAIVADLQTDYFGDYQKQALTECMQSQPDLILFAGDYVQVHKKGAWKPLRKQINDYLREINLSAPLGVYAVHGNTDHPEWMTLFEGVPVKCMMTTESIDLGPLRLTGLGLMDSFAWDLDLARPENAEAPLHIVLGHGPDFARSQNVDADLLIAGHTHGGQVRLPGFGPLMTASSIPRSWAVGLTRLDANRQLLVSRGIGMERGYAPRLRFLCRPELAIVDLVPSDASRLGDSRGLSVVNGRCCSKRTNGLVPKSSCPAARAATSRTRQTVAESSMRLALRVPSCTLAWQHSHRKKSFV